MTSEKFNESNENNNNKQQKKWAEINHVRAGNGFIHLGAQQ